VANHFLLSINNKRAALALSDYLNSIGIVTRYEEVSDGANIYLQNSLDMERAKQEVEHFRRYPNDPKYLDASWQAGTPHTYVDPRFQTGNLFQNVLDRAGGVTKTIAAASIIVFFLLNYLFQEPMFHFLRFPMPALNETGEWWRFITPIIMHFSWLHITFNLLAWMEFASKIEREHGSLRLIALMIFIGTLSNLVQFYASGPNFGGLSGVLFGLFGYMWIYGKLNPLSGLVLRRELVIVLMLWLAFGFTPLAANVIGPIANAAHLAGLVAGLSAGLLVGLMARWSR